MHGTFSLQLLPAQGAGPGARALHGRPMMQRSAGGYKQAAVHVHGAPDRRGNAVGMERDERPPGPHVWQQSESQCSSHSCAMGCRGCFLKAAQQVCEEHFGCQLRELPAQTRLTLMSQLLA